MVQSHATKTKNKIYLVERRIQFHLATMTENPVLHPQCAACSDRPENSVVSSLPLGTLERSSYTNESFFLPNDSVRNLGENYFLEGSQAPPACRTDCMCVEQWWNGTDRGKLEYWEKNIIQRGW